MLFLVSSDFDQLDPLVLYATTVTFSLGHRPVVRVWWSKSITAVFIYIIRFKSLGLHVSFQEGVALVLFTIYNKTE